VVAASEVKQSVAADETRTSPGGHRLRWLLMLAMTCLAVVLLMTLVCNAVKLHVVTSDDLISVHA